MPLLVKIDWKNDILKNNLENRTNWAKLYKIEDGNFCKLILGRNGLTLKKKKPHTIELENFELLKACL